MTTTNTTREVTDDIRSQWVAAVESANLCCPESVCDAVLTAAAISDEAAQAELDAAIANDAVESDRLGVTQQISISMDQIWAGSGRLVDGVIVDCGAQFCRDNDESLEIYEMIEQAIAAGRDSVRVEISDDDDTHVITWSLS